MVKVLEIRSGKIRDYEKRYVGIMVKLGHVSLIKEPEPELAPIKVRNYTTEAMEPANVSAAANPPVAAMTTEAAPELVTKPKRVYRRRDMKAEGEE